MQVFLGDNYRLTQWAGWPLGDIVAEHPGLIRPYLKPILRTIDKPGGRAGSEKRSDHRNRRTATLRVGCLYKPGAQTPQRIKELMSEPIVHTCKSCHNQFTGSYCNNCGEKVRVAADRTFRSFINDLVRAITLADNKFARTLWLIFYKPGFVSTEIANGRTVRYMSPLQVFFVLNLVYFLFPIVQLFNASLTTQMMAPLGFLLKETIARKMASMHMNLESFALVYNLKTISLAKLLVMVFVVLASVPLNFLYRKRNRYFTDHFGYAVELACFNLFINAIAVDLITSAIPIGRYIGEGVVTGLFIATNLYFLIRSSNIFYNEHGWKLVLKSALMILFLKVALELYRTMLFFVTIWSL